MIRLHFLAALALVFVLTGCVKDKKIAPPPPPQQSSLVLDFSATVNDKPLRMDSTWYTTANQDSFTVSKLDYYISNIKLRTTDGYFYSEPFSYHINRHSTGTACTFTIRGLPVASYNYIEFLIGVDSVANSGGAQTGALETSQGMYWDWQTGYVFFKLEGLCKTHAVSYPSDMTIHVGTNANVQKCYFNLAETIDARNGKQSAIHYLVNVNEVFSRPVTLSLGTYHAVSGGPPAAVVAKNYKDMFTVSSVEN